MPVETFNEMADEINQSGLLKRKVALQAYCYKYVVVFGVAFSHHCLVAPKASYLLLCNTESLPIWRLILRSPLPIFLR